MEDQLIQNVVGGVVAGLIVLAGSWIWGKIKRKLASCRFRQVFGYGAFSPKFALIYADLQLADLDPTDPYRYTKPGEDPALLFSMSRPVPISEVRGANYLANAFGQFVRVAPSLLSDKATRPDLNLDFISFGGPDSNWKTRDCQTNNGNCLVSFDQRNQLFVRVSDGKPVVTMEDGFDYGLILKVHPSQFPSRVWIVCAGIGEWGTSGAAWFLANKWEEIRKDAKSRPFAAVVCVSREQDESGELVYLDTGKT